MSPALRAGGAALAVVIAAALPMLAPSARAQDALFEAPAPGSYELPPITHVKDHLLLAPDGQRVPLLGLGAEQVALVAFVYGACSDATGCPAALATLKRIDAALAQRPQLASHVRLVTASFDPARDTPQRMGDLAAHLSPETDWRFLTAEGPEDLSPVLTDFGQDATILRDAKGDATGAIRHVVKIYLVDARGDVRNVYSSGLLSVPLVLADLETVVAGR
jgi:cytochrome oxidase Cu insertion factor (SCO1/SenC/PrrC family)